MVVLDVAIVNVALPSIKTDLHFSESSLQWVISAYAIFFGGLLLLGGRLADLLGRRRIFIAGLAFFTASSLLCGLVVVGELADRVSRHPGARRRVDGPRRAVDPDHDLQRGTRAEPAPSASGARPRAAAALPASWSAASSRPTSRGRGSSSSTCRSARRSSPSRRGSCARAARRSPTATSTSPARRPSPRA